MYLETVLALLVVTDKRIIFNLCRLSHELRACLDILHQQQIGHMEVDRPGAIYRIRRPELEHTLLDAQCALGVFLAVTFTP